MIAATSSERWVLDSCVWIEVATRGSLATAFAPLMRPMASVIVPTVVQFELFRWFRRERDDQLAGEVIGMTSVGEVVPLTSAIALHAAELGAHHRLAMADAVIYATARHAGVDLVTCDAHFEGLPGVRYVSKAGT